MKLKSKDRLTLRSGKFYADIFAQVKWEVNQAIKELHKIEPHQHYLYALLDREEKLEEMTKEEKENFLSDLRRAQARQKKHDRCVFALKSALDKISGILNVKHMYWLPKDES